MCEPMTIMAAVGAGLSLLQQQDMANQQNAAADAQEQSIRETAILNYDQANRMGIEDSQNQAVEQAALGRDIESRLATGRAQAGASGVSGLSVDAMLLNLAGKGLDAATTSEMNYARTVGANQDRVTEIERSAVGQMQSVKRANGVGLLDVVGEGLQVGTAYYGAKGKTPNTNPVGGAKVIDKSFYSTGGK